MMNEAYMSKESKIRELAIAIRGGAGSALKIIDCISPHDFLIDYMQVPIEVVPLNQAVIKTMPEYKPIIQALLNKAPALANVIDQLGNTALHYACDHMETSDNNHHRKERYVIEKVNLLLPHMDKEVIAHISKDNTCFLHPALARNYYKVVGSLPPELLINILSNYENCADPAIVEGLFKARDVFNVNISLHPEIAENYFYKGNILYAVGKKDKALASYDQAVELDYTYADKVASNVYDLLNGSERDNTDLMDYFHHYKSMALKASGALIEDNDYQIEGEPGEHYRHDSFDALEALNITAPEHIELAGDTTLGADV